MWALLCNPTSGGGRGRVLHRQLVEELKNKNISFVDITASSAQEASEDLAALHLDGLAGLIVVGGDGLIHLAIQRLARTEVPLLVIPAGTGNDFARSLNLDVAHPLKNLEYALNCKPQSIDLGLVGDEYFAQILSTGFDSLVNERANKIRFIRGRMKYNLAILLVLPTFKPKCYKFTVDGVSFESKAMLIAVSNGKSYGGGMLIAPMAELNDGFFDLMILGPVSRLEFVKVFPKVYSGSHVDHPAVKFIKGKKVIVDSDAVAYADGEPVGNLPIECQIVQEALLVWRR